MKIKGNKQLNIIFRIMSIFSVVTLVIGIGLGYYIKELQDDINKSTEVKSEEKAISVEEQTQEYLNKVFQPRLTIVKTTSPMNLYYTIQNRSASSVYIEKAEINAYSNEDIVYTTTLNVYKLYQSGEADRYDFQIPNQSYNITKIAIKLI